MVSAFTRTVERGHDLTKRVEARFGWPFMVSVWRGFLDMGTSRLRFERRHGLGI